MINNPLIFAAISDLAGIVRGKAFPVADLQKRLRRGVGWTPTNVMITCFDRIADSPFGALGDLLLVPDAEANVEVDFGDGGRVERFMLSDVTDLGGKPWDFCTRSILRACAGAAREGRRGRTPRRLRARVPVQDAAASAQQGLFAGRVRRAPAIRRGAGIGT